METEMMMETEVLSRGLTVLLEACKIAGLEMKYNQRRLARGKTRRAKRLATGLLTTASLQVLPGLFWSV